VHFAATANSGVMPHGSPPDPYCRWAGSGAQACHYRRSPFLPTICRLGNVLFLRNDSGLHRQLFSLRCALLTRGQQIDRNVRPPQPSSYAIADLAQYMHRPRTIMPFCTAEPGFVEWRFHPICSGGVCNEI
jgi:hypothetical protein